MKKFIIFICLTGVLFSNSIVKEISFDPFINSKKTNYSLSDISNYPIGIFKVDKKFLEYNVSFNSSFDKIEINEKILNTNTLLPYVSTFDNYINFLISSNQKFNLSKPFSIAASDTTIDKKTDRFMQIADIDLGALGRASLRVQGNINLSGKLVNQDQELVRSSYREQEKTNFKFDQKQQLNVQGKVGERITVSLDQNSERDFDWENTIRVDYQGEEDDILQKLEMGNISLSLPSTEFVTFSGQNKGLFGVKALSKLGPVNITSIASLEKTKKQSQRYKGTSELT